MFGPIGRPLAWILTPLLALTLVACKREVYPGAPQGYNFKTLALKWKFSGDTSGTREIYIETKGYEDGHLLYKRMATLEDTSTKSEIVPGRFTQVQNWYFNVEGVHTVILADTKTAMVTEFPLDRLMNLNELNFWLPLRRRLIARRDLTQEQRNEIKRSLKLTDAQLEKFGATIKDDELMGHKVKHFVLPVADGTGEVWMYGDIRVKSVFRQTKGGKKVENIVEPTMFEVNDRLPGKPFEVPKDYKVEDRTKPVPQS